MLNTLKMKSFMITTEEKSMSDTQMTLDFNHTELIRYKTCTQCKKYFLLDETNFNRNRGSTTGFASMCKSCDGERSRRYKKDPKNEEKIKASMSAYFSSERGFITNRISTIFKPSRLKKRKGANTFWIPECTKEDIWELLFLHIEKMKEKFKGSDGRICSYCEKPWTYTFKGYKTLNKGFTKRKWGSTVRSNFSIDRLDTTMTYRKDNIVFCCSGCNDEKKAVTFKLCKKILEIKEERDYENKYETL